MNTPKWIGEEEVRERLPMPKLIDLMAETLASFSTAQVEQPVRTVVEVASDAFFGVMPALIRTTPALGAKLVTVFGSNIAKGLPTHLATILLLDPATGALLTVMDGRYITEARTAAVSAVSTRYMAREDAAVLALIGSGVQAHSHLEALTLVRNFREIRCWSPTRSNLDRFVAEHPQVQPADSAQAAVAGADVIALVTASTTPVIQNEWVQDGTHVIAVGACRPTHREIDPKLVARARLIVDSRAAALKESGDVVLAIQEGLFGPEHIKGELGEVVSGSCKGRDNTTQVTIFKSLGLACEDVAAADLVFDLI
ncbi:MAG: ornithine cyclodeaminase family protein [Bryobacteraceae bacterium]|jgi:ornithine cyclodeaminase/alanine dehydrogenase-like protein (mu-crystallin family)